MESKKKLQFNDYFKIFRLCFIVLQGAIEHLLFPTKLNAERDELEFGSGHKEWKYDNIKSEE